MKSQPLPWLLVALLAASVPAPAAETMPPTDAAAAAERARYAGHYYLEGVMEVGSELLLKPDGRFEWMLSYGAVDQQAEGQWESTAGGIVLQRDQSPTPGGLFSIAETAAWNEDAQQRLQRSEQAQDEQRVYDACPFMKTLETELPQIEVNDIAARRNAEADGAPASADGGKRVDAALAAWKQASTGLERSVARAMAKAAENSRAPNAADAAMAAVTMHEAQLAAEAYLQAVAQALDAHAEAGLPTPDLPQPDIDRKACQVPRTPAGKGGYAVVVGNLAALMRLAGVGVEFRFKDGHVERRVTDPDGWALVPSRRGAQLREIEFSAADGSYPSETLRVPGGKARIFAVDAKVGGLEEAPFETLILEPENGALRSTQFEGRYVRH